MRKYIDIQEAEQAPSRIKPKKTTLRHIIIKLSKGKDRFLKDDYQKLGKEVGNWGRSGDG